MGRFVVVSMSVLVLLVCAGSAQAAQRFAGPDGTGSACTAAAPCELEVAVGKAKKGDEVIVGAGTYFIAETIRSEGFELEGLDIHGDPSGPMPKIVATATEPNFAAFYLLGEETRLADLEISMSGSSGSIAVRGGSVLERLHIVVTNTGAKGVDLCGNCLLRDSLVWVQGKESTAVAAQGSGRATAYMRNVTAIATGPESSGATSRFLEVIASGSQTLDIANSIVSGSEIDLRGSGEGEHGNIVVSHSNFRTKKGDEGSTVTSTGGNQTSEPLFVDAASGNFEEAAGSPTIDAGAIDELIGSTDLAGKPRVQGATIDIGAYEYTPPSPPSGGGSTGPGTVAPPPPPPPPPPPTTPGALTLGAKKLIVDSKGQVSVPLSCSAIGPCTGTLALVSKTGKPPVLAAGKKKKPAAVLAKRSYSLAAGAKKTVVLILRGKALATARGKGGLAARLAIQPASGKSQLSPVSVRRAK